MKMVGITPCYRITLENGSYGVETYINADSKIQITFEDGNTLIGYIECVEYGTYSDENDTLVIRGREWRAVYPIGKSNKGYRRTARIK